MKIVYLWACMPLTEIFKPFYVGGPLWNIALVTACTKVSQLVSSLPALMLKVLSMSGVLLGIGRSKFLLPGTTVSIFVLSKPL